MNNSVFICGELAKWPSKYKLAKILRTGGLKVNVGSYSIRIKELPNFVFQEYGRDLGKPHIEADAESLEIMLDEAGIVSKLLANAGIKHRFEIYNDTNNMVGYLHHKWPINPEKELS